MSGNHDNGDVQLNLFDGMDQFKAVHALHSNIGQNEIRRLRFKKTEGLLAVESGLNLVAFSDQESLAELCNERLVIHHQDPLGLHRHAFSPTIPSFPSFSGSRTKNLVPCPTVLSTSTSPPCRLMIPALTAKPTPVPIVSLFEIGRAH